MTKEQTILTVENKAHPADEEVSVLQKYGYRVFRARNGQEAIEKVTTFHPDMAVIDVDLGPGSIDSSETARAVQALFDVPIVFLCGKKEGDSLEKTREIPGCGYVLKESGECILIETIAGAMNAFDAGKLSGRKDLEAREIIDNVDSAILHYNNEGKIIYFSRGAERMFGYRAAEIIGTTGLGTLNPETDTTGVDQREMLRNIISRPEEFAYRENENLRKNGQRIWIAWRNKAVRDERGNHLYTQSIGNDITRYKRIEEELRESLAEKGVLLRELNHRVKNNLSIIASLIRLKASSLGGTVDLSDIEHQIDVIRIVHEKLYKTDEISYISLKEYFRDILESVFSTFTLTQVELVDHISDIRMPTNTAIPLGLIINEVATNAIKHGFNRKGKARFTVDMTYNSSANLYVLTLANTGKPFPPGIDFNHPATLGLRLITALVKQLDGTIALEREPHPVFTIQFPGEANSW